MTKREKLCLQMRNKHGEGQENETYCRHYTKKFGGYLFHLLFGFQSLSVFIFSALSILMAIFWFTHDEDFMSRFIPSLISAVGIFFWLYFIIQGLWFWKYTKHMFVTDEGIWIMTFSTFWWRGAPDFMGKRKFWAPSWSLYGWSELKKVSDSPKGNSKSASKIGNAFDAIDDFMIRLTGLKTIYLTRWDGTERIDFLTKENVEEILSYYNAQKRAKKRAGKYKIDELITD